MKIGRIARFFFAVCIVVLCAGLTRDVRAQGQKPNIVVI
jgi:hypothetical protein